MKTCPNCNSQVADGSAFCTACGAKVDDATQNNDQPDTQIPNNGQHYQQQNYTPYVNPFDHTSEFNCKDISENKIFAMICYLLGIVGIIITSLAAKDSAYARFHMKQAIKFLIIDALMAIIGAVLIWTIIVPLAWAVMAIILLVIKIICFFQVCYGKAEEPAIIRNLSFLR